MSDQTPDVSDRRNAKRAGLVVVTLVFLVAQLLIWAGPASARVVCGSKSRHWAIKDGSVGINVAWIELHVEVCTNGTSMTSSSATVDSDETGPGTAAGFVLNAGSPHRVDFDSGGFGGGRLDYRADNSLRDCLPGGITVWCGDSETFRITARVDMLNALVIRPADGTQIVVDGRVFDFSWGWKCTNSVCGVRLS